MVKVIAMISRHWVNACRSLCMLFLIAAASGCGYHLRGSVTELTDPGSIFVDASRDLSIDDDLRDALRARAFTLTTNRDEAEILLRVTGEEQEQRVVSVQSTGTISELELIHAVDLQIAGSVDDQPPVYDSDKVANRIEVRREYTLTKQAYSARKTKREYCVLKCVMNWYVRSFFAPLPVLHLPSEQLFSRKFFLSVAAIAVYQPGRFLTFAHQFHAVCNLLCRLTNRGRRCDVRCDDDFFVFPERMVRRQRLLAKNIEQGTTDFAAVQCGQ